MHKNNVWLELLYDIILCLVLVEFKNKSLIFGRQKLNGWMKISAEAFECGNNFHFQLRMIHYFMSRLSIFEWFV